MLRASVWQWHRHLEKQGIIKEMQQRLEMPIESMADFLAEHTASPPESFTYRRFYVEGEYDFAHEMVLRNRMHGDRAGMGVLTPLKLKGSDTYIIVNRGFIPLEKTKPEQRKDFHLAPKANFVGLVKAASEPSWYSPKDAEVGSNEKWLDAWYRVDLKKMQKQLPYPLAAFYLELMSVVDPAQVEKAVVKAESGREELLLMGFKQVSEFNSDKNTDSNYPIPSFDTVIPAGRHLGYVYEWAFMALMTTLICLVLQLRPARHHQLRR